MKNTIRNIIKTSTQIIIGDVFNDTIDTIDIRTQVDGKDFFLTLDKNDIKSMQTISQRYKMQII